MMALFFLIIATGYIGYRVYFQRKYLSPSWIKEYGKKDKPKARDYKDSESGQISREIPKELNESNMGGKGLPTDMYSANINSKRELVS